MKTVRPIEVLLVEDNPGDVHLTQEALKDTKLATGLHVASDGDEAMAFLRREGVAMVKAIEHFWFSVVTLPPGALR
jgi:CheY-like chemotaxis protein